MVSAFNPGDMDVGGVVKKLLNDYNMKPLLTRPQHFFHTDGQTYFEVDIVRGIPCPPNPSPEPPAWDPGSLALPRLPWPSSSQLGTSHGSSSDDSVQQDQSVPAASVAAGTNPDVCCAGSLACGLFCSVGRLQDVNQFGYVARKAFGSMRDKLGQLRTDLGFTIEVGDKACSLPRPTAMPSSCRLDLALMWGVAYLGDMACILAGEERGRAAGVHAHNIVHAQEGPQGSLEPRQVAGRDRQGHRRGGGRKPEQ